MNQSDQQLNTQNFEDNADIHDVDDVATGEDCPTLCDEQNASNTPKKVKKWDKILNLLLTVVIVALVFTVVFKAFVQTNVMVSGESMMPTYVDGQLTTVNRNANEQTVNRGDVVVFYQNHPGWLAEHFNVVSKQDAEGQYKLLIKRAVALAGDKIWVEQSNGTYILKVQTPDGQILEENYYLSQGKTIEQQRFLMQEINLLRLANYTAENPYTVADGCFFAMGDNRSNSHDSRYSDLGDIPYDNLFGVVIE